MADHGKSSLRGVVAGGEPEWPGLGFCRHARLEYAEVNPVEDQVVWDTADQRRGAASPVMAGAGRGSGWRQRIGERGEGEEEREERERNERKRWSGSGLTQNRVGLIGRPSKPILYVL